METLVAAKAGAAIPIDNTVVLIGLALVVLLIAARIAVALRPGRSTATGPGAGPAAVTTTAESVAH